MHKNDYTRAAFKFEAWICRNVACPNCQTMNLRKCPPNMPHIDAICMACGTGVSVKRTTMTAHGDHFRAAPASKRGYLNTLAQYGADKLFVLTGNERGFKFYSYKNHTAKEISPRRGEAEGRMILSFRE